MLGLPDSDVKLCRYNPMWKWLFYWEWLRLRLQSGSSIQDIQHFGSTAMSGMIAKPILDIGIAVVDYKQANQCIEFVEQLGYIYRGENTELQQHYFVKGRPPTHYLYILERESEGWKNRIRFRDYLLQHPNAAYAYSNLKIQLAMKYSSDRESYQNGKLAFVQQVLQMSN
jgi:GrpB-like predicted nucleotidyltransferase (UPF0157 family)